MVSDADSIITGSFLNLDAVCNYLIKQNKKVLLACSAWKDRINIEDSLFAGAVAERIKEHFTIECDSTRIARELYLQSQQYPSILEFVRDSNHYRRLAGFGLLKDLEYCTTPDLHPVVPIYNGKELIPAS
jgi:2-phosphosulfolactate phosphatase